MSVLAITGLAALTPLGDSPESIHASLCDGRTALCRSPELRGLALAAIEGFDPLRYADVRGMRMYNRTTRLAICAAKLALDDARIDEGTVPAEELGLIMASSSGHLDVLMEYDRSLVENGIRRTNAALMPLAIPSAPGAIAALALGAKAFSMTLSDAGASSLDAIGLGARWVEASRARACIVVAAFSWTPDIVRAIERSGMLSTSGDVRPFDQHASGTGLGEGAVAFVIERDADASRRGATARGRVHGFGAAFGRPASEADMLEQQAALERACITALRRAGASVTDVVLASAAASGDRARDRAEASALRSVLGDHAVEVPLGAANGAFGETIEAAGAHQLLVALASLRHRKTPPIARLERPAVAGLRYAQHACEIERGHALVTSLARDGSCSALVVSGGDDR